MCSDINPKLTKHVVCEEWWIDEKDIKIEVLDDADGCIPSVQNCTSLKRSTSPIVSDRAIPCNEPPKAQRSNTPKLAKSTFFGSIKRFQENSRAARKEESRSKCGRDRSVRKKKSESTGQSILKNLRYIVNSRQNKGVDGRHKKHKHRKGHDKKEDSKKKRKLDKIKRRLKTDGALLNLRMVKAHKTSDDCKGNHVDLNDNNARFANQSCSALRISSNKSQKQSSDCNLFRPCSELHNNPSKLWERPWSSSIQPQTLKQGATSSFGLLESTQFNNSSACIQDCALHPISYTPQNAPVCPMMRAYDVKRVTDPFCCDCNIWDFEKDPCLLDPFRYQELDYDVMMRYNPVEEMCRCKRKNHLSIPSTMKFEEDTANRCCCSYGEGSVPKCCERKDSVSEIVSRLLKSMGSCDVGSRGPLRCTCANAESCQPVCTCPPQRRCDYRCCTPALIPEKYACNLRNCTKSGIRMIPIKRCSCQSRKNGHRCCSCQSHCCKKRSKSCCCEQKRIALSPCCCPKKKFGYCNYETFCNDRGQQFWRKPVSYRNQVFARSLAAEKSCCLNKHSRFRTLTPRCSKCMKKFMLK